MTDRETRISALTDAFPNLGQSLVASLYEHHDGDIGACVEALAGYGHRPDLSASQRLEQQRELPPVPDRPLPKLPSEVPSESKLHRCLQCEGPIFLDLGHLDNFCGRCGAELVQERALYEKEAELARLQEELNQRCTDDPESVERALVYLKDQMTLALPLDKSFELIQAAVRAIETAFAGIASKLEAGELFRTIADTVRGIKDRIKAAIASAADNDAPVRSGSVEEQRGQLEGFLSDLNALEAEQRLLSAE